MKLSFITGAYESEVYCLVRDCKTTTALETLKLIEVECRGARELLDRIIFNTPYGEVRNKLLDLFAKKEREFYSAKDEAFARLTKITATA